MDLDSCPAHRMPPQPPESSFCSRLGSKSGESQLKGEGEASKLAKVARRRRMELRRIRSYAHVVSTAESSSSPPTNDIEMQKEAIEEGASMETDSSRRRSHGKISVVGRRREMDDAVAVELGFLKRSGGESYDFFGVFDGRQGRRVARACSQMLPRMLAQTVEQERKEIDWEEVMIEGFHEVEAKMHENGAAAAAAVVGENKVVVAGLNSKAVMSRGGVAVRLLDGGEREVVQVRVAMRSGAEEFLILGSHGFWDVISDDMACQVAGRYCGRGGRTRTGGAEAAVALMAEMAVAHGSKHNVTIILVDLLRGTGADEEIETDGMEPN